MEPLPRHIADLIREGRTLEAIKLLREETGVGLREAKDAVERIRAGLDPLPPPAVASAERPADVEALARAGKKIEAIKRLREQTGLGLKEAKEQVEAIPGAPPSGGGCGAAVVIAVAVLILVLGLAAALLLSGGA